MEFWTKTKNENTFGKLFEHELHELYEYDSVRQ